MTTVHAGIEELLIPAVVFIIWAINAVITAAKKKQEGQQDGSGSQRPYTPLSDTGNDDAERTRRIQEEIRRKIAERRGEAPAPPQDSPRPSHQQREQAERPQASPPPMPSPLEAPRPMTSSRDIQHQRPRSGPSYGGFHDPQREMLEQIEAKQREAAEAQRKAEAIRRQTAAKMGQRPIRSKNILGATGGRSLQPSIRGSLKRELRDPAAIRKAVLHYEILGTPVGLRNDDELKPSWKT